MSKTRVAITNVNIFDGDGFHEGTVIIDGGKIGADTDSDSSEVIIDGRGKVIDMEKLLETLAPRSHDGAGHGNISTASDAPVAGKPGLMDTRSVRVCATSPGSTHSRMPGLGPYLISDPAVPQWPADRINEGSDYTKVVADVPGPDQATINALVAVARERGKLTVAHAASHTPFTMAVEAKTDVITHVPMDKALESATVVQMLGAQQISVPTVAICEGMCKKMGPLGIILKQERP